MPKDYRNYIGALASQVAYETRKTVKGVFNLFDDYLDASLPIEATGGTKVTSGANTYHVFTSPGTFSLDSGEGPVEFLVIGGGGSGGGSYGPPNYGAGGGGAGGFRTGTTGTLTPTSSPEPITIGAGGPIASPANSPGSPSTAFSVTSAGGGRGASFPGISAGNGGSGGGAIPYEGPTAAGDGNDPPSSPPQGNPGGHSSAPVGGGGGGAGEPGGPGANNPNPKGRGYGGDGLAAFSSDANLPGDYGTPGPGVGRYFAGGGAGGTYSSTMSNRTGGAGGGGQGGYQTGGTDGGTNTGGGGGGSGGPGPNNGHVGGSGVVIIKIGG